MVLHVAGMRHQGKSRLTKIPIISHVGDTNKGGRFRRMSTDRNERQAVERVAAFALVCEAQLKSESIRRRLAVVAGDLRIAAAQSEIGSEHLLNLANRFERQSRAGDNV